jgi:hypothetical protein
MKSPFCPKCWIASYNTQEAICSTTIFFNISQGLTFLSRNLYGRYPSNIKFQNSEYAVLFLVPKKVAKSAVRFVLR